MFCFIKNLKLSFSILTILITIATIFPVNLKAEQAINVNDAGVRSNTSTIITNTATIIEKNTTIITNLENIIKTLSGELPGAQMDNIKAREELYHVKLMLKQMTDKTVTWVNTGFNGNPAYIVNTGAYLQDGTDKTIDYFVTKDTALNSACDPNALKRNIGSQYSTFQDQIGCTFTDSAKRDAFTGGDFEAGGGWDSWLLMTTVPQNNPMGAMVIAQDELNRRIENQTTQSTLEANWGNGFMSWKDCTGTPNPDRNYDGCNIKTPGSVIANKLNWAETSALREM